MRLAILGGAAAVTTPEGSPPGLSARAEAEVSALLRDARGDRDRLADLSGCAVTGRFEEALASCAGARYGVSTSSGTAALTASLLACGVAPGDEVVVSPYGWGGTAGAILAIGATPVFADIDGETFNLDPMAASQALAPRTRAILATHLFGHPADIDGLRRVAADAGVRLVFDAAQALGSEYRGAPIGNWGDIVVVSFGRGKIVGAGEGGMALTSDAELFERLVLLTQHPLRALRELDDGRLRALVDEAGMSCRMHPLATAVGLGELAGFGEAIARRRRTCLALASALEGIPGIRPPRELPAATHAFHQFALTYRGAEVGHLPRQAAVAALQAEGVPVTIGPVRTPIHRRLRFAPIPTGPRLLPMARHAPEGAKHTLLGPQAMPVAEHRCAEEELLLESASRWHAVSERRIEEIRLAFIKVTEGWPSLKEAPAWAV